MAQQLTYGVDELSNQTGLSKKFIWALIYRGELKSFKIGKRRLVAHDDLVAFLDAQRAAQSPP